MKIIELTSEFLIIAVITFIVSSLVTLLYNLIIHAEGAVDWETAIRLSIIFGIILSWMHYREKKK